MNVVKKILYNLFDTFAPSKQYSLVDLNTNGSYVGWKNWNEKLLIGHSMNIKLRIGDSLKVDTKTEILTFQIKKIVRINKNKSKIYLK